MDDATNAALVPARTLGAVGDDLTALRTLVRRTQPLQHYQPAGDPVGWRDATRRIGLED